MKKFHLIKMLTACLAFFSFCLPLAAQEANRKSFLPSFSNITFDYHNIYVSFDGRLGFPVVITSGKTLTGMGGGFSLETGYELDDWLGGLRINHQAYAEGDSTSLMSSCKVTPIYLEVTKLFDSNTATFLPNYLNLRASAGLGINIMSGIYYTSLEAKTNGYESSGTAGAFAFNIGGGAEYTKLPYVNPFATLNFDFSCDSGGLMVFTSLSLGVRTDVKKMSDLYTYFTTMKSNTPKDETPIAYAEKLDAQLVLDQQSFTPDGDGTDDKLKIGMVVHYTQDAAPATWKLTILSPSGAVFKEFSGNGKAPSFVSWDGYNDSKELVQSATNYPVKLVVTDAKNNTATAENVVTIGILVVKDATNNNLTISIPSIEFDANKATFYTLTKEKVKNNEHILDQIAETLKQYQAYRVMIVGHANATSGTDEEEANELIPLSQTRADVIKFELIKRGVDSSRLSSFGVGGKYPIATGIEGWKNRRVEFVLTK